MFIASATVLEESRSARCMSMCSSPPFDGRVHESRNNKAGCIYVM